MLDFKSNIPISLLKKCFKEKIMLINTTKLKENILKTIQNNNGISENELIYELFSQETLKILHELESENKIIEKDNNWNKPLILTRNKSRHFYIS